MGPNKGGGKRNAAITSRLDKLGRPIPTFKGKGGSSSNNRGGSNNSSKHRQTHAYLNCDDDDDDEFFDDGDYSSYDDFSVSSPGASMIGGSKVGKGKADTNKPSSSSSRTKRASHMSLTKPSGSSSTHRVTGSSKSKSKMSSSSSSSSSRNKGKQQPILDQLVISEENLGYIQGLLKDLYVEESGDDDMEDEKEDPEYIARDNSESVEQSEPLQLPPFRLPHHGEVCAWPHSLERLLKLGFHRKHVIASLEMHNGNETAAISEILAALCPERPEIYSAFFPNRVKIDTVTNVDSTTDYLTIRMEERDVLSSIYGGDMVVRHDDNDIDNIEIWEITLKQLEIEGVEMEKKPDELPLGIKCTFFTSIGGCRYGDKCKNLHVAVDGKEQKHASYTHPIYQRANQFVTVTEPPYSKLQIRFPKHSLYPLTVPLLLFRDPRLPTQVCLSVTARLLEQVCVLSSSNPVIYDLIMWLEQIDITGMLRAHEELMVSMRHANSLRVSHIREAKEARSKKDGNYTSRRKARKGDRFAQALLDQHRSDVRAMRDQLKASGVIPDVDGNIRNSDGNTLSDSDIAFTLRDAERKRAAIAVEQASRRQREEQERRSQEAEKTAGSRAAIRKPSEPVVNVKEMMREKLAAMGNRIRKEDTDFYKHRCISDEQRQRISSAMLREYVKSSDSKNFKNLRSVRMCLPAWNLRQKFIKLLHGPDAILRDVPVSKEGAVEGGSKSRTSRQRGAVNSSISSNTVVRRMGSQVIVISGATGCGKTTQIPQFILDYYLLSGNGANVNIICTQPRRISAIGVADRVAKERGEKVGGTVGYQIRLESMVSQKTRLLFCTTGILLRRLEGDCNLEGVTHIVVDEVHERSLDSDFLIMVLRDLMARRSDLYIILMSATLNAGLFCSYFNDAPVLDIPGRTFPVTELFLEDALEMSDYSVLSNSMYKRNNIGKTRSNATGKNTSGNGGRGGNSRNGGKESPIFPFEELPDEELSHADLMRRYQGYSKVAIEAMSSMDLEKINYDLLTELIVKIVSGTEEMSMNDGAMLVFLPGFAEIQNLYDSLHASSALRAAGHVLILPLHSTLSSSEQAKVFDVPPEGVRKIVLSTNIAETSVTIEDVVVVIDSGKMKETRYDPAKKMASLEETWVSRANALQRRGRAGRVREGWCVHMFTSHHFDLLDAQQKPEIQRVPLEQVCLRIKMLDIFSGQQPAEVLGTSLEPPTADAVEQAMSTLHNLNALDERHNLTPLGYHLASLPMDVRMGKMLLFGCMFSCLDPVLTIAAAMTCRSPFVSPFDKRNEADAARKAYAVHQSDALTILKAYNEWIEARYPSIQYKFCHEHFLSFRTFEMMHKLKCEFAELLGASGFLQKALRARSLERLKNNGDGDGICAAIGEQSNVSANNVKLIKAVLCAALYPNIVAVRGSSCGPKFFTHLDGPVALHPTSVNAGLTAFDHKWLIYHEKVKTSKVYVRDSNTISIYPLLFFGGKLTVKSIRGGGATIEVDSDGFVAFRSSSYKIAGMFSQLRSKLDLLLEEKVLNPHREFSEMKGGEAIIAAIVQLITTQE